MLRPVLVLQSLRHERRFAAPVTKVLGLQGGKLELNGLLQELARLVESLLVDSHCGQVAEAGRQLALVDRLGGVGVDERLEQGLGPAVGRVRLGKLTVFPQRPCQGAVTTGQLVRVLRVVGELVDHSLL